MKSKRSSGKFAEVKAKQPCNKKVRLGRVETARVPRARERKKGRSRLRNSFGSHPGPWTARHSWPTAGDRVPGSRQEICRGYLDANLRTRKVSMNCSKRGT